MTWSVPSSHCSVWDTLYYIYLLWILYESSVNTTCVCSLPGTISRTDLPSQCLSTAFPLRPDLDLTYLPDLNLESKMLLLFQSQLPQPWTLVFLCVSFRVDSDSCSSELVFKVLSILEPFRHMLCSPDRTRLESQRLENVFVTCRGVHFDRYL